MSFRHSFSRTISRYFLFTLFLFVSAAPLLGMNSNNDAPNSKKLNHSSAQNKTANQRVNLSAFNEFKNAQGSSKNESNEDPNPEDMNFEIDPSKLDPEHVEEMRHVLEAAPDRAKLIIKHLKNRLLLNQRGYRVALFWGEPGTGKSTTAEAIAYEMWKSEGWKYQIISSAELVKKYRNSTAQYLKKLFDEIDRATIPTMLIFEEMNELLENAESENHDTSATSKVIFTRLDRKKGKHNFFCIGTMNRIDKLAKPFKDRYISKAIKFLPITDTLLRNNTFRRKLTNETTLLHYEVTNNVLNELLERVINCSGRNLEDITSLCSEIGRINDPESSDLVIREAHIAQAIEIFLENRIEAKYDQKEESDKEQRERHHQESLGSQWQMHDAQMRRTYVDFNAQEASTQQRHEQSLTLQEQLHQAQIAQATANFDAQEISTQRRHEQGLALQGQLHRAQMRRAFLDLNTQEANTQRRHAEGLQRQDEHFVQGIRAQTFFGTNSLSIAFVLGLSNINRKKYAFNYVLNNRLAAINERLEQEVEGRPTNFIDDARYAVGGRQ